MKNRFNSSLSVCESGIDYRGNPTLKYYLGHSSIYTVYCTVYSVYNAMGHNLYNFYIVYLIGLYFYSVPIHYTIQYRVYSVLCIVYSVQCTVYSV